MRKNRVVEHGAGAGDDQRRHGTDHPELVLSNTSLLMPGKSVMLGSLDIPDSTRHREIDVALEQMP